MKVECQYLFAFRGLDFQLETMGKDHFMICKQVVTNRYVEVIFTTAEVEFERPMYKYIATHFLKIVVGHLI